MRVQVSVVLIDHPRKVVGAVLLAADHTDAELVLEEKIDYFLVSLFRFLIPDLELDEEEQRFFGYPIENGLLIFLIVLALRAIDGLREIRDLGDMFVMVAERESHQLGEVLEIDEIVSSAVQLNREILRPLLLLFLLVLFVEHLDHVENLVEVVPGPGLDLKLFESLARYFLDGKVPERALVVVVVNEGYQEIQELIPVRNFVVSSKKVHLEGLRENHLADPDDAPPPIVVGVIGVFK